jgi:hypothetical protein
MIDVDEGRKTNNEGRMMKDELRKTNDERRMTFIMTGFKHQGYRFSLSFIVNV